MQPKWRANGSSRYHRRRPNERFKLDENPGERGRDLLKAEGYDVMTVADQRMSGASDEDIYKVCQDEARIVVTLDHDFGQTLRFPPEDIAGIVVLECKGRVTPTSIDARIREFVAVLKIQTLDHELWIVEPG